MDNLVITWIFMALIGLSIDVLAYVLLRAYWKKSGVVLTDKLWDQVSAKLSEIAQAGQERLFPAKPLPNPTPVNPVSIDPAPVLVEPEPPSVPSEEPAEEIIPVYVENIGQLRRVQFSLDMQMNTTMEVRIGPTSETGVKVEKREI